MTRVDDGQDYELVIAYRWHVQEEQSVKRGRLGPYARTNIRLPDGRRTSIKMHQLLMPEVAGVDHVDGDGLNNQRITNLREATTSQNGANQQPRLVYGGRVASSAYKGVCWDKANSKWRASICVNRRQKYLGLFFSEINAALAYDAAAREAFGVFARPNFPAYLGEGT